MPMIDANLLPNWIANLYKKAKNQSLQAEDAYKTAADLVEAMAEHIGIIGLSIHFSFPKSEQDSEVQKIIEKRLSKKTSFGDWIELLRSLSNSDAAGDRLRELGINLNQKAKQESDDPLFHARKELGTNTDKLPAWNKVATSPIDFMQAVLVLRNQDAHYTLPDEWKRRKARSMLDGVDRILELCTGICSLLMIHVSKAETNRGRDGVRRKVAVIDMLRGDPKTFEQGRFEPAVDAKEWEGNSLLFATEGYATVIPVPIWLAQFTTSETDSNAELKYFKGLESDKAIVMHSRPAHRSAETVRDLVGAIENDAPFLLSAVAQVAKPSNSLEEALVVLVQRASSRAVTLEFLEGVSAGLKVPADELRARVGAQLQLRVETPETPEAIFGKTLTAAVEAAVTEGGGPRAIAMLTRFGSALPASPGEEACRRLVLQIAAGRLDRSENGAETPSAGAETASAIVEEPAEPDPPEDESPNATPLVDDPELATMTVAAARSQNLRDRIVAATGLSPRKVTRDLNAARGQTLLKNIFTFGRPSVTPESLSAEVEARRLASAAPVPFHELFRLTAAQAAVDEIRAHLIQVLDIWPQVLSRRLNEVHGRTLLGNIFGEQQAPEWIRKRTVRWAIDAQADQYLCERTRLPLKEVRTRLVQGAPQRTLENVFPEADWAT